MANGTCDSHGREIVGEESRSSTVEVWVISPHINSDYDECLVRDYHDAVTWAQHTVEMMMDDTDKYAPIELKISCRDMNLGDYLDMLEDTP